MSWNTARRLHFLDLLIQWSWTGVIHTARAHLVDDADCQIAADVNLAREAHVISQFLLHREAIAFKISHRPRIAFKDLNPTRGATRITATTMKNIDTGIFNSKYQFLPFRCIDFDWTSGSFSIDLWHL